MGTYYFLCAYHKGIIVSLYFLFGGSMYNVEAKINDEWFLLITEESKEIAENVVKGMKLKKNCIEELRIINTDTFTSIDISDKEIEYSLTEDDMNFLHKFHISSK